MRVLADLHHQALYHSLLLLFEDRLGYEVYRPIGTEWHTNGFWKVYEHPATVGQFLGLQQAYKQPTDVHGQPLPESAQVNRHYREEDGIYYVWDAVHNRTHRAITLDKFKSMQFDILISSLPQHIAPFNTLIGMYQHSAKHIFQVGNAWGHQPGVNNILSSTAPFAVPPHINICFYHQEFDLNVFKYEPPACNNVVHSYVHYMKQPELMDEVASYFPGWTWKRYGAGFPEALHSTQQMADAYRRSAWTWHFKPEGDGFGHTIHASYACGRSAIINFGHYRGKAGSYLLEDMVTAIDLGRPKPDLIKTLQHCSQPSIHKQMCENAYNKFKQVVDFDAEAVRIKQFIDRLK